MSDSELRSYVFLGEGTFLFQKQKKQIELNSLAEKYKTSLLGHYATVPELHAATHF